jgi:hypothetical protein
MLRMTWHLAFMLRTVFLHVPTIPSPVGVGRVVRMLELQTWYKKVTKDNAASAYVLHPLKLPSSQFMRGWIKEI